VPVSCCSSSPITVTSFRTSHNEENCELVPSRRVEAEVTPTLLVCLGHARGMEAIEEDGKEQGTCPLRARSAGQRRELTVTSGQADIPAHVRKGWPTRCANRPSKQGINGTIRSP